jgi:hypothetical protein
MNNNTKIRLHLSKNLFESVAREVLAEAKRANDGYTVAVKQPKMPKQSKSQAISPEVQKTDAEATMGEADVKSIPIPGQKPKMPPVPGQKPAAGTALDDKKKEDFVKKAHELETILTTLVKAGTITGDDQKAVAPVLDKIFNLAGGIKEVETEVAEGREEE